MDNHVIAGAALGSLVGYYGGSQLSASLKGGYGAAAGAAAGGLLLYLLQPPKASGPSSQGVGSLGGTRVGTAADMFAAEVSGEKLPFSDDGTEWLVRAPAVQQMNAQRAAQRYLAVGVYYNAEQGGFVFYPIDPESLEADGEPSAGALRRTYSSDKVIDAQQSFNVKKQAERAERAALRAATLGRKGAAQTLHGAKKEERSQAAAARAEAMRPQAPAPKVVRIPTQRRVPLPESTGDDIDLQPQRVVFTRADDGAQGVAQRIQRRGNVVPANPALLNDPRVAGALAGW